MLQQNWAVIEPEKGGGARIHFISDTSGVFDEIALNSVGAAREALSRNGFRRISDDTELQSFLRAPTPPFPPFGSREWSHLLVGSFLVDLRQE